MFGTAIANQNFVGAPRPQTIGNHARSQGSARTGEGARLGLFKLLTFPVSLPVSGGRWVLQTLLDEAERRYYDEAAIRHEMAELERQLTLGEVDDHTFDRREEELLARLLEARAYRQRKEAEQQDGT